MHKTLVQNQLTFLQNLREKIGNNKSSFPRAKIKRLVLNLIKSIVVI